MEDPNLGKDRPLREQSIDKVAGVLQNIGFDQYSSYKTARQLLGNPTAQNISESIGVLDFTPLQIPFAAQEAKRAYDKGDYVESALTGGFAALETLPFMKLVSTPVKSFFKSLGSKMTSETPTDLSRRKALGTIAAAPIAVGTLSEVPVAKMIDDAAPAVKKIPKGFKLTDLSSFKKMYDDYTDTVFRENSDMYDSDEMSEMILDSFDVEELEEMGIDPNNITRKDYLDDRIAERLAPNDPQAVDGNEFLNSLLTDELKEESLEGTLTEELINEIKQKYPDSTDEDILNELKKYKVSE
tara:strand:- start:853 stop:1746 length:894 start_codon:yes stop_codon:yes gene_type:complete